MWTFQGWPPRLSQAALPVDLRLIRSRCRVNAMAAIRQATGGGNAGRKDTNKQWAAIIHAWAGLLTRSADGETRAFGLEDGAGVDAVFRLNEVTGWSRPSHHHRYFDRKK